MSTEPELEAKFKSLGLSEKSTAEALKSKAVRSSLETIIDQSPVIIPSDPSIASLLFALATLTQKGTFECRPRIIRAIIEGRLKSARQIEGKCPVYGVLTKAAVEYMKRHDSDRLWVESDFEAVSGIGIHVTEADLVNLVDQYIATHKVEIVEGRYKTLPTALKFFATNPMTKWADSKERADIVTAKFEAILGPKDERDFVPVKKVARSLLTN
jgi:glutaminyl-tRNA synthetase